MIIVSQDKNKVVNFDNIAHIFISKDSEKHYLIEYGKMNGSSELLGIYETVEGAKEVLQEIIKSYRHYRTAECDGYTNVLEETAVFEMPKE